MNITETTTTRNVLRAELVAINLGFRDALAFASEVGEYGTALTSIKVTAKSADQTTTNVNKISTALTNRGYNCDWLSVSWHTIS